MPTVIVAPRAARRDHGKNADAGFLLSVIDESIRRISAVDGTPHVLRVERDDAWSESLLDGYRHLWQSNIDAMGLQVLLILTEAAHVDALLAVPLPRFAVRVNALFVSRSPTAPHLLSLCGRSGGSVVRVVPSWDTVAAVQAVAQLCDMHYTRRMRPLRVGAAAASVRLEPDPSQCSPTPRISSLEVIGFQPSGREYVVGAPQRLAVHCDAGSSDDDRSSAVFAALLAALSSQRVLAVVSLGGDGFGCLAAAGDAATLLLWPPEAAEPWALQLAGRAPPPRAPSYADGLGQSVISVDAVDVRVKRLGRLCKSLPQGRQQLVDELNALLAAAAVLAVKDVHRTMADVILKAAAQAGPEASAVAAVIARQLAATPAPAKVSATESRDAAGSHAKKRSNIAALLNED